MKPSTHSSKNSKKQTMSSSNSSFTVRATFSALCLTVALLASGCIDHGVEDEIASETFESVVCTPSSIYAMACYARTETSATANCYCDNSYDDCVPWLRGICEDAGGTWTQNALGKWGCLGMDNPC